MTLMIRMFTALLLLAAMAPAQAGQKPVFLEAMTWTELRDAIAGGATTAIVPVGGTEQSGPLIALGKHNVRVHELAGKIAMTLGNCIVAPVIAYVPEGQVSPPTEHMKFPGTLSVPDQVFVQVVEAAGRSLRQAGFTDIVLIGDHGGYQSDLATAASALNKEWSKSGVKAHFIAQYYRAQQEPYAQALLSHGVAQRDIGTHAGLADTSLMLAVDPALVRGEGLAQAGKLGAADGVYGGNPSTSTAEFGQLGVDLIVRQSVEAIRLAIQRK